MNNRMPYIGSYIWKIRQKIEHDLLILPSADAVAVDDEGRVVDELEITERKWLSVDELENMELNPVMTKAVLAYKAFLETGKYQMIDAKNIVSMR